MPRQKIEDDEYICVPGWSYWCDWPPRRIDYELPSAKKLIEIDRPYDSDKCLSVLGLNDKCFWFFVQRKDYDVNKGWTWEPVVRCINPKGWSFTRFDIVTKKPWILVDEVFGTPQTTFKKYGDMIKYVETLLSQRKDFEFDDWVVEFEFLHYRMKYYSLVGYGFNRCYSYALVLVKYDGQYVLKLIRLF